MRYVLVALLLVGCGKASNEFPDVSGLYLCEAGAHGDLQNVNAVVIATSKCVRIN